MISLYPTQYLNIVSAEDPKPSVPEFRGVTPAGDSNNYIFEENQTVTILYDADRFDVDGIVLVGDGSGLQLDPVFARNFTKISSEKAFSYYEIELNVSGYTYFFAYSWSKSLTNNSMEVLDLFDNAPGHQMWTEEGSSYPTFVDVVGGTPEEDGIERSENEEFYAALGTEVTIVYEARDPTNSTVVTLSFANSTDALYNDSLAVKETMTYVSDTDNILTFNYNYTVTQRWVYFTASNEYGSDRVAQDEPVFRTLTNGFEFNVTFTEALNQFDSNPINFQYTDLDTVVFNVTTVNATDDDEFYYRYRHYENASSEDPVADWTETKLVSPIVNKQEINKTIDAANFTQTVTTFNVIIDVEFDVGNIVELQTYVEYFGSSYNESSPYSILIRDSRPDLSLLTANDTITRASTGFIDWEYSTLRGSITTATISSNTTSLSDSVLNLANYTVSFADGGDTIEENHEITITVTNFFDIVNTTDPNQGRYDVQAVRNISAIYRVDTTGPTVSFVEEPEFTDSIGRVTLKFNFEDMGANPTGVAFASLSWGNGLVIDVTDLNEASIKYRYSSSYNVTLKVIDLAGNFNFSSFDITAEVPEVSTSNREKGPMSIVSIIGSFVLIGLIASKSKRRTQ